MFQDSEGRYVTSRQWHDEKFLAFLGSPAEQAAAPSSLLLGGMQEDEGDVYAAPRRPVVVDDGVKDAVEVATVEVIA